MPSLKHQYRIEISQDRRGRTVYMVGIKYWYFPFWQRLGHRSGIRSDATPFSLVFRDLSDIFGRRTILKDNCFYNVDEAESFAIDYATRGLEAWVHELKPDIEVVKYLGKLP